MTTSNQKNIPALRFKEFDGEWEVKTLDKIGRTLNGLTGKTKDDFGEGKPYIQYKQIFDHSKVDIHNCGLVKLTEKDRQTRMQFGDVFFTTIEHR